MNFDVAVETEGGVHSGARAPSSKDTETNTFMVLFGATEFSNRAPFLCLQSAGWPD